MDFATALIAENTAFADLLRDADLSIPVPTCPEWTLEQLMRHVGRGDRWCAQIVAEQSMDFIDPRTVEGGKPPAGRDNEIAWLQAGPRQLIDAVAATGADTAVWTFLGPRPASWWIRRRLHEVVVHRADAAIALGVDYDVDPALAADAITEWLERVEIQADEEGPAGGDRPVADEHSIHLHATDSGLGEAGSGPSSDVPTASPSSRDTAKPRSRCGGRHVTCCWPSYVDAAQQKKAWKSSATRVSGTPGWHAHRFSPVV